MISRRSDARNAFAGVVPTTLIFLVCWRFIEVSKACAEGLSQRHSHSSSTTSCVDDDEIVLYWSISDYG